MTTYQNGPSGGVKGTTAFSAQQPEGDLSWRIREFNLRSGSRIDQIQVEWENSEGDIKKSPKFGGEGGHASEFDVAHNDFLTKIEGTVGSLEGSARVSSLKFTTNSGHSSKVFGNPGSRKFFYEAPDGFQIIGIFGRAGSEVDALGVYITQEPP